MLIFDEGIVGYVALEKKHDLAALSKIQNHYD